eukprot:jgi/Mesvir1/5209/Mv15340-RA.1
MRRKPGIGGLQGATATKQVYRAVGENVRSMKRSEMQEQLATFKKSLQDFAMKHKDEIRRQPVFRAQFHEMCSHVGVDPLASNKGFWAEVLGIGDFYYELGVQIVDACLATRPYNGGLIDLNDLRALVVERRKTSGGASVEVSRDDCVRAIGKLKILGGGFSLVDVGTRKLVRSVPYELNRDHNRVLEESQKLGYVTVHGLVQALGWTPGRVQDVLDSLLKEGLALVDDGAPDRVRQFWFPSSHVSAADAAS